MSRLSKTFVSHSELCQGIVFFIFFLLFLITILAYSMWRFMEAKKTANLAKFVLFVSKVTRKEEIKWGIKIATIIGKSDCCII